MAEDKLIGPQPIIGAGDSPDKVGGTAPMTEYAPMNNAARVAIFGTNPATGVAYTDAESAALNAGNNVWGGAIGYQIDPRTNNLNILLENGTVMTTGATYRTTSTGAIVPDQKYMQGFNQRRLASGQSPIAFDEYGVQVNINPNGPTVDSQGKVITVAFDAAGNSKNLSSFTANATGSTNNPFAPGSDAAAAWDERKSAYDLLYSQFKQYGLDSLVKPLQGLIMEGVPASEFAIRLRETEPYKQRFGANQARIGKGLRALSEAEYIQLEDQYQDVMRRYGLPENYYTRGDLGRQEGFEKFLAGDVSPVELEDRIQTAQKRVINSNPEVLASLKAFYPDITNSDILAYTLDPKNAIEQIKRKVTAAEIGGAAMQAGLQTGLPRAEQLQAAGVTKETAQQGFGTIAGGLQRGSQLASIYGENPYTQTTAETEVFGLAGAQEAAKQRKKLTGLEKATFGGQTGLSAGALVRDRAGAY
jgi:hypothetical protein